jgi:hypothetical protein
MSNAHFYFSNKDRKPNNNQQILTGSCFINSKVFIDKEKDPLAIENLKKVNVGIAKVLALFKEYDLKLHIKIMDKSGGIQWQTWKEVATMNLYLNENHGYQYQIAAEESKPIATEEPKPTETEGMYTYNEEDIDDEIPF